MTSFISSDEVVIIFDTPNREGNFLSVPDLQSLVYVGVKTCYLSGLQMEDYNTLEAHLHRYHRAGMKCIVPLWSTHNPKLNRNWYSRKLSGEIGDVAGHREYILSPWNLESQSYANDVLRHCRDTYNSSMVQCVSSIIRDGESVMPHDARCYDPAAISSWQRAGFAAIPDPGIPGADGWVKAAYVRLITEQQRILTDTQWREAWFMLHLPKQGRVNCGVDWIEDYYTAIEGLGDVNINHVTFEYFPFPGIRHKLDDISTSHTVSEWVGAQYCEGLRAGNGVKALEHGRRGVIIGPCHGLTGHTKIEPWMLKQFDKIRAG